MDHSHAANKSIKHYTDAKRVATRKATGTEGLTAAAVFLWTEKNNNMKERAERRCSVRNVFHLKI